MDRRQALKEGMRSLGQALPLVLGTAAGFQGWLQLAGEAVQVENPNPLTVKRKKPGRRDPECK